MKAHFKSLALLAVLAFSIAPGVVRAQDGGDDQGVSLQVFYDQLGDQGTWIQTDDYGYVFQPDVQDPNWAPYTQGHWVSTDQGWTWVSDEPWGWATYHYGRWANINGTGWVWVPGYQWAPAWVSWRYGGDFCGWAPLPPESMRDSRFGNDVDVTLHIGAGCYSFVRVEDIGQSNYQRRFVDRSQNYTIINATTNITNITVNNRSAANSFQGVNSGGPPLNEINARATQHVQSVRLTQAGKPGRSTVTGSSLSIYAPRVNTATVKQARPAKVSQTITHPTFNRGDSMAKPLDVTATVKAPKPTSQAIQASRKAATIAPTRSTHTPAAPAPVKKGPVPVAVQPNVQHNSPPGSDPVKPAMTLRPNSAAPEPAPAFHAQAQSNQEIKPSPQAPQQSRPQTQSQQEARPHVQPQPASRPPVAPPQQQAPRPPVQPQQETRSQQEPQHEARSQGSGGNSTNGAPLH